MADSHQLLPGVSRLIAAASKQFPRYSEADVIPLRDGRLLLGVARKEGASDFARGQIITLASSDEGRTWSDEPTLVQSAFDDVGDLMSVSLLRTRRGLHLFFLGRGPEPTKDTRVYQMLSGDEGQTWQPPKRVSDRAGYHIVNNARVIRTAKGRIIVPCAFVPGDIHNQYDEQRIFCYFSDDDGATWKRSNDLALDHKALMEPGVAQCADGSLYMTIRTALGVLYEARSRNEGETWEKLAPTTLPSPAAPSTVVRLNGREDLWLFWCDHPNANWKGRSRLVFASSRDNGATWSAPRTIEEDPQHSYGYTSVTPLLRHVLLTYYDWRDNGQANFDRTSLRARIIPTAWFDATPVPPVFRTSPEPVLKQAQEWEGSIISMNSGLLAGKTPDEPWQLWYTSGGLGPQGERLSVCHATSRDRGRTWSRSGVVLPPDPAGSESVYHASAHRDGEQVVLYAWRRDDRRNGLYRYTCRDGAAPAPSPDRPMLAHPFAPEAERNAAGEGHFCNDAFDILHQPDGSWQCFAAWLEKATDPQTIIPYDNAVGLVRVMCRSTSEDGTGWSPTEIILRPEYDAPASDPADTQFYGMQVFRHRGFYLGLLHVFHVRGQTIQPEWAWSHDGITWTRTRTAAIPLGDEGCFDSRMIVFGSIVMSDDEVTWLYSGYDWRHNAFRRGEVSSAIGRATLSRRALDAWLDTLPQP